MLAVVIPLFQTNEYGVTPLVIITDAVPSYNSSQEDWKNLAKRDDIDLVVIATPWRLHTPMSLFCMENNKHVACEVPIAYKLEDCWKLTQTSEKTKKHCIMLENCNYNSEELWILNMINEGVFGDITHTEGAYLHDLRALLLDDDYYQGPVSYTHLTLPTKA